MPHRSPTEAPEWVYSGRIPSIDGLRGVSIALVLAAHLVQTRGFRHAPGIEHWARSAAVGVQIFFAISGFLITLLLLREQARGGISLRGFYFRRVLRIVPAYVAFLLGVALLQATGHAHLGRQDWLAAVTYTVNFLPQRAWEIGHVWSLSIEEHFYLVWPLVLTMLAGRQARNVLVGYLAAAPMVRIAIRFLSPQHLAMVNEWTFTAMDTIAAGCLLALWVQDTRSADLARRYERVLLPLAAAGLIGSIALGERFTLYRATAGYSINALCITAILAGVTYRPESWVGRVCNWKPLCALGALSYSLYLWQQIFLNPKSGAAFTSWPLNLPLALAAAVLCHLLIERPFLRLKGRAAARAGRHEEPDLGAPSTAVPALPT